MELDERASERDVQGNMTSPLLFLEGRDHLLENDFFGVNCFLLLWDAVKWHGIRFQHARNQ